jgi:pyruvate/2-oxoglutarate dehydrogenase complex dihydrolipoamide dehydrogenase (E3) component
MKKDRADLAIIGAGAAGLSLAAGAAQLGLKTILIEGGAMGGDCLNTGCVPSKSLLAAAKAAHFYHHQAGFGVIAPPPTIDIPALRQHVRQIITDIAPHDSQERFEGLGVTVIRGWAHFIDCNSLMVNGQKITARHIVIATGTHPFIPAIPGLADVPYLTNETIFDLIDMPRHLIIIGGGAIGVEMAQAHRRLGAAVTIIQRREILPSQDPDLVAILRQQLIADGVEIVENAQINHISSQENTISINLGQHTLTGSHVLIATGRRADLSQLRLENAQIIQNDNGIPVNPRLQTSQKNIWAIGDIAVMKTGEKQNFTHLAGYHAGIVLRNIAFALPAQINIPHLPQVIYTDPELAQCGMTERTARASYGNNIQIFSQSFVDNDRARCERRTEGKIKIILRPNGIILGVGIIGPGAGELIGVWGLAIQRGLTVGAIASMMVPYPVYGDINRQIAGQFYRPKLFHPRTRWLVRLLKNLT